MTKKDNLDVIRQVLKLKTVSLNELNDLWYSLYKHDPISNTKMYMIPQLAYRIQELAQGGENEDTQRKIQQVAHDISKGKKKSYKPLLGTKIVKEYKDKLHEIFVVMDSCFSSLKLDMKFFDNSEDNYEHTIRQKNGGGTLPMCNLYEKIKGRGTGARVQYP
jgi:uncharacterized protein (UPF0212 family)